MPTIPVAAVDKPRRAGLTPEAVDIWLIRRIDVVVFAITRIDLENDEAEEGNAV